ncbi:TatD family hydrolase [Candidatus Berkiella cookevillensis]
MMLVDSHCHLNMLNLSEFDNNLDNVMLAAKDAGVTHFLCVSVTLEDHATLSKISQSYDNVSISTGLHPNELPQQPLDVERLASYAEHPKIVAIGETGLDYFRSEGDLAWQQERFCQHIEIAKKLKKPLIIHTREAKADTIEIMKREAADKASGVMHCFTEDWEMAKKALDLNFYISFSGIVTFKTAHILQDVAKKVPLDRMLVETDCPYLAPIPHRGKMNQPAYVKHVAEFIAQLRNTSFDAIAQATTENYFRLFNAQKS